MNAHINKNNAKRLSSIYPTEKPDELVDDQAKKIPNLVFMGLAGASIAGSIFLALRAKKETDLANFVAHWAPTFLLFGVYNKIVKLEAELLNLHDQKVFH